MKIRDALFAWDPSKSMENSNATGLACPAEESLTIQSQKDEADINIIVERFGITGQLPQGLRVPQYSDFGDTVFDYRSAVEAVAMAQDSFLELPGKVRAEFDNDPQKFLEFCMASDDGKTLKNVERMRELGLAVEAAKPPAEAPAKPAQSGSGGNPQ